MTREEFWASMFSLRCEAQPELLLDVKSHPSLVKIAAGFADQALAEFDIRHDNYSRFMPSSRR